MNARLDANEVALNQYLGEIEADERRERKIQERADYLMTKEYNPALPDNVLDAFAEITPENIDDIVKIRATGDMKYLGEYIDAMINNNCASQAADVAKYDVNRNYMLCQRCGGHGCGKCLED